MLMPGDRSGHWPSEEFSFNYDGDGDFGSDLSIDIGTFFDILSENPDSSEGRPEDLSFNDVTQGFPNNEGILSSGVELSRSPAFSPSYNFVTSDVRTGISDSSSESPEKFIVSGGARLESSLQLGSPVHSSSGSLTDWIPIQGHGHFCRDKEIVSHSASSSSLQGCKEIQNEMYNYGEQFSFADRYLNNHIPIVTEASNFHDLNHETDFQFTCLEGVNQPENSYENRSTKENKLVDSSDLTPSFQFTPCGFDFNCLSDDDHKMVSTTKEKIEILAQVTNSSGLVADHVRKLDDKDWEVLVPGDLAAKDFIAPNGGVSLGNGVSSSKLNEDFPIKQEGFVRNISQLIASQGIKSHRVNDMIMKSSGNAIGQSLGEESKPPYSSYWISNPSDNRLVLPKVEKDVLRESKRPRLGFDGHDGTASGIPSSVVHDHYFDLLNEDPSGESRPSLPEINGSYISNTKGQVQCDSSVQRYHTVDDEDVCILEDISGPARPSPSAVNKSPITPQSTVICNSFNSIGVGHMKLKENGERFVFRAALEDLCQPKGEVTPPEGALAVPLLKHQRIALSWMVKKEIGVSRCCGGILADDQGLGKTISTIALILKERSPSATESNRKQSEPETLNLDDDDDDIGSNVGKLDQGSKSCQVNASFCGQKVTSVRAKHRPAAGTLIVCPTSVLRQWSEELQNKVTDKAKLSVLVYHGSNRTKDPHELAKYDVVLTTYSIVSMEVPKQPLVDEDDDETKCTSDLPMELSFSKRRKYPPSSSKKSKRKDAVNGELRDIRPLAGVGWFRVVLDEAQSIKNHRTQVARACWGLRAKRRWCLSGTPIQNAVDDLYSYFRFLKFDPFCAYKQFCSEIKGPIHKNSVNGYRRLQAVLKTIMLRRTKGTFLDGEPIIRLPPKTIKLYKVDFTPEERDFYCRLEADSCAQFAEYAAAGTVKQNYVNILLMLLRLRQACDHPLLVSGFTSGSKSISSVEMAKKLPREKQIHLLNSFEASVAICGLCSDLPEDAVVTSCGHVFCNQCVCEHLSGDDNHCPTTNCKAHLNRSNVFSVATLRCSLSDQTTLESVSDCSRGKLSETSEPLSLGCAYDSSKIRAALEVLTSLTKRQNNSRMSSSRSIEEGTNSVENTLSLHSGGWHENLCDEEEKKCIDEASSNQAPVMGEKAIVFSQWTRMLDLLEDCLKDSSIQYRRLDGTMSVVARDKAVKDFNSLPEVSVMIMSLKAASLGLNMVAACHVLLLDLWWNPTTEDQAIDRAHRIGQTRPVTVLRLTVKDTVEDRILALQQKKREMVASAFGEDETGSQATRLTVDDLDFLFRRVPS